MHVMQVQLEQLTASFQNVTDDMRQRFVVDGQTVLDESIIGTSPIGSFRSGSLRTNLLKLGMGRSGLLHTPAGLSSFHVFGLIIIQCHNVLVHCQGQSTDN